MRTRLMLLTTLLLFCLVGKAEAQQTPWYQWTLLPSDIMDEIIGESSGESAWNSMVELGGYVRARPPEEYATKFFETRYVMDQLRKYEIPGAQVVRFPGGRTWNAEKGELWEISPMRQKLASYQDLRAMLANGSQSADVTAELVWVGRGTAAEVARAGVEGKIAVTEGPIAAAHQAACVERGALGVISIYNARPLFDPLQIPWSRVGARGGGEARFGFFIPPREGEMLKRRLLAGETIRVHAQVETTMEPFDNQNIVAQIPGTDPDADEVIFSAHLFEGYVKQDANDNFSGSGAILEIARTLHTLIEEGRIPQPRRTIRFLWGPEFAGTGPWVRANTELMERTLANINLDMVGEWLSLNKGFMTLVRTSYGNPHFINDVMENYYRFVGESNRERIQNRRDFYRIPRRIVAPSGADEPFYYSIETHYGASDHMVFNDWSVQVPGVMMIAWPDQWYHTSGDRTDKADPTQLKRVVIIGAAAAYTIATADDDMAMRLASEIASNGGRRLAYQYMMGLERLNHATADDLAAQLRWARAHVEASLDNEKETMATVLQLADDRARVQAYVDEMQKALETQAEAHLSALEVHMREVANRLGTDPVTITPTELERRAAGIVPRQTGLVKRDGYRGWRDHLRTVSPEVRERFPVRGVANTNELQLLINGRRSALDIKKALDAQNRSASDLRGILNHLEILKAAALVEF